MQYLQVNEYYVRPQRNLVVKKVDSDHETPAVLSGANSGRRLTKPLVECFNPHAPLPSKDVIYKNLDQVFAEIHPSLIEND